MTPPHDGDGSDYDHEIWMEHAVEGLLPGVTNDVKALVCTVKSNQGRIVTWKVNGTAITRLVKESLV